MARNKKPRFLHTLIEMRALMEAAVFNAVRPLIHGISEGDDHAVLVVPGFMASDLFTAQLRRSLTRMGYRAEGWGNGTNVGMRQDLFDKTMSRVIRLCNDTGKPVTLIGWSLGGVYCRAIANTEPALVRQVITLGSPFNITLEQKEEVNQAVRRLYDLLNPTNDEIAEKSELANNTPPVPFTSIYTRSDGVVDWRLCVDANTGNQCQNIRIRASHCGLTHNPLVLYLLLRLLPQRIDNWKPLKIDPLEQWLLQMQHTPMPVTGT